MTEIIITFIATSAIWYGLGMTLALTFVDQDSPVWMKAFWFVVFPWWFVCSLLGLLDFEEEEEGDDYVEYDQYR